MGRLSTRELDGLRPKRGVRITRLIEANAVRYAAACAAPCHWAHVSPIRAVAQEQAIQHRYRHAREANTEARR